MGPIADAPWSGVRLPDSNAREIRYNASMTAAAPQPRWYRPRLKWVLFGLLAVEAFLLLSEQLGWFGLNRDKVMTAAIAVAAVIVPIIVVLFWIVARWVYRRRIGRGNAPAKPRWYHLTPDRLVIGVLIMECLLWLSQQFGGNEFTELNCWIVLTAVTVIVAKLLLLPLWFIGSLLFRWRFQFGIRSLLVLVVVVAIPFSWVAVKLQQAKRQREGIAIINDLGGYVRQQARQPDWWLALHRLFPDVVFEAASYVEFKPKSSTVSDADLDGIVKLLPHIDILFLASTNVTDAGLDTLNGLHNLQWLSLNDTKVTDVGLEHLNRLTQLKVLYLNGTHVTDVGLEHLKGHHLWGLHLNGTQITDVGLGYLKGHRLTSLELNDTRITDAGLEYLKGQDKLQLLHLNHTTISDSGLEHLKELTALCRLELCKTQITDAGLKHLKGLKRLGWLWLNDTKVGNAGLEHLKSLTELQELLLNGTHVTDAGLENLKELKLLGTLGLDGTNVTDAGLDHLKGLELQKLSLARTQVTKAGVKKLQQTLPGYSNVQ